MVYLALSNIFISFAEHGNSYDCVCLSVCHSVSWCQHKQTYDDVVFTKR